MAIWLFFAEVGAQELGENQKYKISLRCPDQGQSIQKIYFIDFSVLNSKNETREGLSPYFFFFLSWKNNTEFGVEVN